jgi:hypothetical protein
LSCAESLTLSAPSGALEEDADRAADNVMHGTHARVGAAAASSSVQREASGASSPSLNLGTHVRRALGGGGTPLISSARSFMERGFQTDFSRVRIHANSSAGDSAAALQARAFTVGQDIVFGRNEYAPDTQEGRRLLAHELAHTVQARSAPATRIYRQPTTGSASGTGGGTPAKRVVYLDANVLSQISRGNAQAAAHLKTLLSSADVRISHHAYQEAVENRAWGEMRTANRMLIEDLGIKKDEPMTLAQRSAVGMQNWGGEAKMQKGPLQHKDVPIVAGTLQTPGAELWTFDSFANNQDVEKRFGVKIAPECAQIPALKGKTNEDYSVARELMGLDPVVIDASGKVERRGRQGAVTRGGTTTRVPSGQIVSGEIDTAPRGSITRQGVTRPVASGQIVSGEIPTPHVPRGGAGGGGGGGRGAAAAGAGVELVGAIAVPIINHYLQEHYAEWRAEAYREIVGKALEDAGPRFRKAIDENTSKIKAAQAQGLFVSLHVVVQVGFVESGDADSGISIGTVPHVANIASVQTIIEGEKPKPYDPDTNWLGDSVRFLLGHSFQYPTYDIPLEGTDLQVRRQREVARIVEPNMGSSSTPFEKVIVDSRQGSLSEDVVREYAAHRRDAAPTARPTLGKPDRTADYWARMEALSSAPLDEVIIQAKIQSVSLEGLRNYAVEMKTSMAQSSDAGYGAHAAEYWAEIIRLVDAPLDERYAAEHRRAAWEQGGTLDDITDQQAAVDAAEKRLSDSERLLDTLEMTDARTAAERAAGEPPHPPWAKVYALKARISELREDVALERRLLKDLKHKR